MKVAILFGPPGAGKGTQCALLSERLGFTHISTGTIIRQEIASRSPLGLQVKDIVESGRLVEDKIVLSCLESALKSMPKAKKELILLDGIPRNIQQAVGLEELLTSFQGCVNKVVSLAADLDHLVERFKKRWTCSVCGKTDSIDAPVETSTYRCASCGTLGSMMRRKDDDLETVKKRFSIYQQETSPLIAYYQDKKVFETVDGLLPPEIVYVNVASILMQI